VTGRGGRARRTCRGRRDHGSRCPPSVRVAAPPRRRRAPADRCRLAAARRRDRGDGRAVAGRPLDRQAEPRGPHGAVRRLRSSAQRLGLLRVSRGRLLATKAGGALREDPVLLWRHVAGRLAARPKDAFARTATALVLVSAAAGRVDGEQLASVMTAAGWSARGGDGVHRYAVTSAAGTSTRCSTSSVPTRGADS
jgi:hypothetical protein